MTLFFFCLWRRDYTGVNLLFLLAIGTVDSFSLPGCLHLLLRDVNTTWHVTMQRPDNGCGEPATPNRPSSGLWFSVLSFCFAVLLLFPPGKKNNLKQYLLGQRRSETIKFTKGFNKKVNVVQPWMSHEPIVFFYRVGGVMTANREEIVLCGTNWIHFMN